MKSFILGLAVLMSAFFFVSCNNSEEKADKPSDKQEEKKVDNKDEKKADNKVDDKVKNGLADANHTYGKVINGKIVDKEGKAIDINLEKKKYTI